MNEVHESARNRLQLSSDDMKRNYDIKSNLFGFHVGDTVWLYDPVRRVGLNPKLQRPWKGPFKLIDTLNDILYRVERSPRHRSRVVNHDKVRMYTGRNLPAWFSNTKDCWEVLFPEA